MEKLIELMRQLRDPQTGCPWDIKQDFSTIAPYTIEEAYEVADAIERGDMSDLKSELGDLLFQVVFHSQMASEAGYFDFDEVVSAVTDKMIERHPHVFDQGAPKLSVDEQSAAWEAKKSQNKASVLDGIANNMPELLKAVKLTKYAAVTGFDWPDIEPVFDKLEEETVELKEAIASADEAQIKDELGDLLFVCANIARHLKIDPGAALRQANSKFENRFRAVEQKARQIDPQKKSFDLKILDELWTQIKAEQQNS